MTLNEQLHPNFCHQAKCTYYIQVCAKKTCPACKHTETLHLTDHGHANV